MEIRSIEPFLDYYSKIRRRTLRVARVIPRERIDWSYAPGKWTFADLLRHLGALERWMFAETVAGRPSSYPGCGPDLADGYDEVFAYLERTHGESLGIFAGLTGDDLAGLCTTPAGAQLPTWKWLRAMVEHEVHHRGQIYLYLGILGIETPPLYGLTSEEVLERSV